MLNKRLILVVSIFIFIGVAAVLLWPKTTTIYKLEGQFPAQADDLSLFTFSSYRLEGKHLTLAISFDNGNIMEDVPEMVSNDPWWKINKLYILKLDSIWDRNPGNKVIKVSLFENDTLLASRDADLTLLHEEPRLDSELTSTVIMPNDQSKPISIEINNIGNKPKEITSIIFNRLKTEADWIVYKGSTEQLRKSGMLDQFRAGILSLSLTIDPNETIIIQSQNRAVRTQVAEYVYALVLTNDGTSAETGYSIATFD